MRETLRSEQQYLLESTILMLLPPFVGDKLSYLVGKKPFMYHERAGSIDNRDLSKQMAFWMPSSGALKHWIFQPGSRWWLKPSSSSLAFEAIELSRLPQVSDAPFWWIIYCSGEYDSGRSFHVYKIMIAPSQQLSDEWRECEVYPHQRS